jgi:hypothetical protein
MTICARVIADSLDPKNARVITFELEYPRFIHSEFMTHRVFSRNASSSRAIPIKKMLKLVRTNMATPIHWGAKQSGMQADNQLSGWKKWLARKLWKSTGYIVSYMVQLMDMFGLHKQVANRMLEPWSHIKVVMTSTMLENWFELRDHKDAQPEIKELAVQMKLAMKHSKPVSLKWGEWHLPYVTDIDRKEHDLETLIQISTTACAQVSYRILDTTVEKVRRVFSMLINSDIVHASPFEHPCRATKSGGSGNFSNTNWKQYRFYIERKIDPPLDIPDYNNT